MPDLAGSEETEAIFDAIIDVLSDPDATKVQDHMKEIRAMSETVREMQELRENSQGLNDTCEEAAAEIIEARRDELADEAAEIAHHILSALSRIELDRGLA